MTTLRQQQDVLARVLTDRVGPAHALPHVNAGEVERFATSLFHKRLHEVEKIIPLTRHELGDSFQAEFEVFYPGSNPASSRKPLEEALGFCAFIRRRPLPAATRAAANFESARLRFFAFDRLLAFCTPSIGNARRRISFAIWLRIGKRVFHFKR